MALTKYFEDLITRFLSGGNFDMRGKRIINAGRSVDNKDYITREEVMNLNSVINGSLINNLDASKITTGTLANARLNIVKGTWTPSNAHVTLTVNSARYWNLDSIVVIQASLVWPVTVDGNDAIVLGSPFSPLGDSGLALGSDGSGLLQCVALAATGQIIPFKAGAVRAKNSDLSGQTVCFSGVCL